MARNQNLALELIELGKSEERGIAMAHTGMATTASAGKAALRLERIIEEHGWPTVDLVGPDANRFAYLIVLHADANASFQKSALELLKKEYEKKPGDLTLKEQVDKLTMRMIKNRASHGRS